MKNLYIDFDGVIVDTIPLLYKMTEEAGVNRYNFEETYAFYANLDWEDLLYRVDIINDGIGAVKKVLESKKFNVAILTHVTSLKEAVAKVNFLRQFFKDITIIPVPKEISKTKMVETKDAILIDDYAGNLREWEEEEGIAIRFNLDLEDKGFKVIDRIDEVIDMF
jgi:hypothetical protein